VARARPGFAYKEIDMTDDTFHALALAHDARTLALALAERLRAERKHDAAAAVRIMIQSIQGGSADDTVLDASRSAAEGIIDPSASHAAILPGPPDPGDDRQ
jgi:hypothetical protein